MNVLVAIVVWIFFGIVIGLVARLLVPGRQSMGWMSTMMLGIVGSFLGGFLTYVFRGGDMLQPSGILLSIVGAIVVLVIASSTSSRARV